MIKSPTMTQPRQKIIAGFLIMLVLIGYTWATWRYFTEPIPGGNDFLARTKAWEAYFWYGYSPYSDEAAIYTQYAFYGRPARADEDEVRLTYPFYSALVHAPYILIEYPLARAIHMTFLQLALFAGVIMTLDLVRWKPPIWLLAVIMVWSILYYPQARGVILGQVAILGYFSLAGSLFLLKRGRDKLAGAALVLSTVKPTLVFLAVPFLMLWAVARRRWGYFWGFIILTAVLMLVSFLLLPTWMSEFIIRVFRYTEYTVGQSPVWLLTHITVPILGSTGEIVIVGILVTGMFWAWWMTLRPGGEHRFFWSLGIMLVVSNLIVPRSATTNYVMMLVTVLWVFAALDRTPGWGRAALLATMVVSLVGLWWLHYATVIGNQEQPIMFIPDPLALGLVLVVGYRWLMRDAERHKLAL